MKTLPTGHANSILAFLQNIDDDDDAREFVRIALDSLETGAEHRSEEFNRAGVLDLINGIDKRIDSDTEEVYTDHT